MYSIQTILSALPHRYPFIFIDKIVEHELGQRAVCVKNVSLSEDVFQGHFPGAPIFPGVLMVEAGLQATQICLTDLSQLGANESKDSAPKGYLLQILKFQFHKPVLPGAILTIEVNIVGSAMGMHRSEIMITDDAKDKVAHGTVSVGAQERP
jgi:3-hydroxyacyl-[acyl-carrier-protein] dehydratase